MNLINGLSVLVDDWRKTYKEDKYALPLGEVVRLLGGTAWQDVKGDLPADAIARLIVRDLNEAGSTESAIQFFLEYTTAEELLEEASLYGQLLEWGPAEWD